MAVGIKKVVVGGRERTKTCFFETPIILKGQRNLKRWQGTSRGTPSKTMVARRHLGPKSKRRMRQRTKRKVGKKRGSSDVTATDQGLWPFGRSGDIKSQLTC
jgi:hypothetical protein